MVRHPRHPRRDRAGSPAGFRAGGPAAPTRGLVVLAAVAAALLAALAAWVTARGGDDPFGVDVALHDWAVARHTPAWHDVFVVVTDTGDDLPPAVLAGCAGVLAVRGGGRRWWLAALVANAALAAGQLVRYGLVRALDRPRPPEGDRVIDTHGPSLPSGHTSTSAMVAVGLAVALLPYCHRAATRALAVAGPAAWAVAVGASRVYLGVHWPTDVLGGWLFATAVTALGLPLVGRILWTVCPPPAAPAAPPDA